MESNNINHNEEVVKGGLIVGGVSIIITMVVYLVDIGLMVKWWYGLLTLTISMGLLIFLGINYRNLIGGFISYKNALKFSFLVFLISYVMGIVFQILLYNIIDPSLPEVIKQLTIETTVEMMESFGTPPEAIDAAIVGIEEGIDNSTTPVGILKSSPWGILFIFIFAAIGSLFIKENQPISDRIN